MSIVSKFKSMFLLDDEYEYKEEVVQESTEQETKNTKPSVKENPIQSTNNNIVSLQSVQKSSKVILLEPRAYSDAQEIADHLSNKRAVVVNLQRIQHDQGLRIVDFLSGTVYAINGDIQRIGTDIFLCTPANVDVSGNISSSGLGGEYDDSRW